MISGSMRGGRAFPEPAAGDVFCGGEVMLFRNPHGEKFGDRDAWSLSEKWTSLEDIRPAYAKLARKEAKLGAEHPFAWNAEFGYLSPFPEHCGTGLMIRTDMHLEALHLIGDLPPVLNALHAIRFESYGMNIDGIKNAAHWFDIYTNASLGITEEDLLLRAERVFSSLAVQETNARKRLLRELPRTLEDAVARAMAVLKTCRLLSPWEYLDILSPIRLASVMGLLEGITLSDVDRLMRKQFAARDDIPHSPDGERMRDERDAAIADAANKRFARVRWNRHAGEYFS